MAFFKEFSNYLFNSKKRFMKRLYFIIPLLVSVLIVKAGDFNSQIGISLKSSTNGIGGDIYFRPFKTLALKAGYEAFNANLTSQTLQNYLGDDVTNLTIPMPGGSDMGFDLGAKLKTGALSVSVGYQPFGGLYFTAGVGSFLLNAQVLGTPNTDLEFGTENVPTVGPVSPVIEKEKIGNFALELKPGLKVAPYFGIGLGSYVPRKKSVSFALEIGAYYMGAPTLSFSLPEGLKSANINYGSNITPAQIQQYFGDINTEIDGVITDLKTELDNQVVEVNEQLKPFAFYPVVKLTIGIKAYEFKKK